MKFGAGADDDPFVKVKDLITDLISRLQAEASSEANQKSYCDEETSKATEKKEDLGAEVAKHFSKLEATAARSIVLDGEISALQSESADGHHVPERHILVKVIADLDRHKVQQRLVEQITETLVTPFVEKIVEMLVDQTREKVLQAANTHAQHVASTVEVETPKIIKEAVRGKKSVIRVKISQVAEHIKNPQIPCTNKVLDLMKDVPVVMRQQMPVQKTAETSQLQFSNKVDEMPVAVQRQVPMVQTSENREIPSQSVLKWWLMTLLYKFHVCRSWRGQSKPHRPR